MCISSHLIYQQTTSRPPTPELERHSESTFKNTFPLVVLQSNMYITFWG